MVARRVAFAVPGDLATPTGGYVYDRRVIAELRALGWQVDVIDLGANFPRPSKQDRAAAEARLADAGAHTIIIDGLAFGVLPEEAAAVARKHRLIALVHHPLALETGLSPAESAALRASERAALATTRRVIASSQTTADLLAADYGVALDRITVAPPGTNRVAFADGSSDGRIHIISVGAVVPRKGYDVLLAALARLAELPWRLTIAGDCTRSPETAAELDAAISRARLYDRIEITGAVSETNLAAIYRSADVFVMASHFEGYGMAAAEAIAYGLPIVATTAGALSKTIPPATALLVPPGNAAALAEALRTFIANREARRRCREAARAAAEFLPTWRDAAAKVAQAIETT